MRSFIRVIKYVAKYWNYAVFNVIFNILSIVFSVVSLTMVIPFLRLLFGHEEFVLQKPVFQFSANSVIDHFNYYLSGIIVSYGKVSALAFICATVVIIFLFKNLFRYLALYVLSPVRNGVIRDIRRDLYNKILHLPISFFTEKRKGDIITRATSDVQEIEWSIMNMLEITFREPVTIISFLLVMLFLSPQLTLFVLIMLPLTALIIGRVGKALKKESKKAQNKLGYIISIIEESISGLRIIKAFNAEAKQNKKFQQENETFFSIMTGMLRKRDLSSPLSEFLSISVVVVVLWFGGKLVLNESSALEPETFIAFILFFSQIIPPAKSFSTAFYHIQKGLASAERIEMILDTCY